MLPSLKRFSSRKRHELAITESTSVSGATPVIPGTRTVGEQAKLVAQIAKELHSAGLEPTAIVVNDTSTSILLPPGAARPIALPISYSVPAEQQQAPPLPLPLTEQPPAHYAPPPPLAPAPAPAIAPSSVELDVASASIITDDTKFDLFVSHCKRTEASEDRAIWVSDVAEGEGLKVFFDRSDLTEITKEELHRSVAASKVLVTILDPYTFDSEWVCLENEWALQAGRPVIGLYDGDRFRWSQIAKWKEEYPHVFKRQVVNYSKDYRVESKKRLMASIKEATAAAAKERAEGKLPRSVKINDNATGASAAAHGIKPHAGSAVRIAVGKSTLAGAKEAVSSAWRHLVAKLGGAMPHLVVCSFTGDHDGASIATVLSTTAPDGCQVLGVSAGMGIMVEDQWLSAAESGQALTLWGMVDPAGAFAVTYDGTGVQQDVKSAVSKVLEPQVTRGLPHFTLCYTTPSFEQSTLSGIHEICGEQALVFGISAQGPRGMMDFSPQNAPTAFALTAGQPFDVTKQCGCGFAAAFFWPSVFIAGAFSPGGSSPSCSYVAQGTPGGNKKLSGTVTKVGKAPVAIGFAMAPPEWMKNASSDRVNVEDCVIVEIDHRPAIDVFIEWLGEEDAKTITYFLSGGKDLDPTGTIRAAGAAAGKATTNSKVLVGDDGNPDPMMMQQAMGFMLKNMIGVRMGVDEKGEPVHKTLVFQAIIDGGLSLFGGLAVTVGDQIELLESGDASIARERTAETANRVIADAGFDFDSVQGALTVGCGLYYMLGGMDDGLKHLTEKLGAALNWAPSMGILGGPELGPMGSARSDYAVFTVGCVVFSSKPAKPTQGLLDYVDEKDKSPGSRRVSRATAVFASRKNVLG